MIGLVIYESFELATRWTNNKKFNHFQSRGRMLRGSVFVATSVYTMVIVSDWFLKSNLLFHF